MQVGGVRSAVQRGDDLLPAERGVGHEALEAVRQADDVVLGQLEHAAQVEQIQRDEEDELGFEVVILRGLFGVRQPVRVGADCDTHHGAVVQSSPQEECLQQADHLQVLVGIEGVHGHDAFAASGVHQDQVVGGEFVDHAVRSQNLGQQVYDGHGDGQVVLDRIAVARDRG